MLQPGPHFKENLLNDVEIAYFDVDNTLVGNEASDPPSEAFIAAAKASPIPLAIASARPLDKVQHIIQAANMNGLAVLSNGAQIYDPKIDEFVVEYYVKPESAKVILAKIVELNIKHWINDDGIDYMPSEESDSGYSVLSDIWDANSKLIDADSYEIFKPLVIVARHISKDQRDKLEEAVAGCGDSDVTTLTAHQIEQPDGSYLFDVFVLHKSANKKTAFREALSLQGYVPRQAMAVGDGRNDEVLLETAGTGVAMGNAADETKAVASHIAPSQSDDGATAALLTLTEAKNGKPLQDEQ